MTETEPPLLQTAPPRIPPRLLALIGERLATSAATMVTALLPADTAGRHEAAGLDRLGLQLQQAVRTVDHSALTADETVDLLLACRQAAAPWQADAEARGVALKVGGFPLSLPLRAAALEQTLDLLIEHGVAGGKAVALEVLSMGSPAQPAVRIDITLRELPTPDSLGPGADADELLPLLATWLAHGSGLMLSRSRTGRQLSLLLTVPRRVPARPVVTGEPSRLPRTPPAAGRRILIVDPDPSSRLQAHRLLQAAGLRVDAVATVPQARSALSDGAPEVLVSGLPTSAPEVADLIEDLRAACPSLRVIELVDAENAFAFSMPEVDAPGRLSRDELDAHLVVAVAEEVDGARAQAST